MPPFTAATEADKRAWHCFKAKAEIICDKLPDIKSDLAEHKKTLQSQDVKRKHLNVIIEQLHESPNESTTDMLNDILDLALSDDNRLEAQILKAFRLGVKTNNTHLGKF